MRNPLVRGAALWALLLGLYAATLGIDTRPGERYAGAEPHHLLAAASIAADGDADLADDYAARAWTPWASRLAPTARPFEGRLYEPEGMGFPAVLAPAEKLGGTGAATLLSAGIAALAFAVGAALARTAEPEPWATRGALLAGASVPAVAYATAIVPALCAGALLAAAALLALRVRESGRVRDGIWAGLALALLPWLAIEYALLGVPVLAAVAAWSWQRGRGIVGLAALEVVGVSVLTYVRVNDVLVGELVAEAARIGARPQDVLDGLWWWAPPALLAVAGAGLVARSRRSRIARVVPERADAEGAVAVAVAVCVLAGAVALGLGSTAPLAAALPLVGAPAAWTLRALPRAGACLAVASVALLAWAVAAGWSGGTWAA